MGPSRQPVLINLWYHVALRCDDVTGHVGVQAASKPVAMGPHGRSVALKLHETFTDTREARIARFTIKNIVILTPGVDFCCFCSCFSNTDGASSSLLHYSHARSK
jgi:hypothetical protein